MYLMILQVSFGTNYYGVDHFDAIVTVNLTGMLVMVTLYQTVNDNLPTTSSIKMIDIWMLFALGIPFLEVILHSAMAWIRQKYERKITKEVVGISGDNKTDEMYGREVEVKVGPYKNVVKRLITVAATIKDDQGQPRKMKVDTNELKRPNILWNQKDERVLRYFVNHSISCFLGYFIVKFCCSN